MQPSRIASVPTPPAFPQGLKPLVIGTVRLDSHFTLAPLAGYTNLPFRQSIREIGGLGLATTDLINARALLERSPKTLELLATNAEDKPLAVQIYGSDGAELGRAAQLLESQGIPIIDINMGCPVRKVVKGGGGSALLCSTSSSTVDMVREVVDAVKIPVTVKMRLGWDQTNITAPWFAREFEKAGVAAITIHGRTRSQGFSGSVNRDGIRQVVEAVERIPVLANGDVRTLDDAKVMIEETGCSGIAIGRGALANPWIFRQITRWLETGNPGSRGTYAERVDFMERHLARLIEWRGEHFGCLQFRKVATWYCKALRTGKKIQQQCVNISRWDEFTEIVRNLREQGAPASWEEWEATEFAVSVPSGPIAHW